VESRATRVNLWIKHIMPQGLTFGCFSKRNAVELLDLSLKAYKALTVLHYFADEHGRVFASQSQMAKQLSQHQQHLSTGLKELCRKGFVFKEDNFYRIDPILIRYSAKEQHA
jgi:DNA-binding MarR family transcriptional regulator